MNCREKGKTHWLFVPSAEVMSVLQLPDWDHHPQASDGHPSIPNHIIPRRPDLLERTKTSRMESTKNTLKP